MFENISLVLRLGWFTGGSWVIVFQKGSFKFMLWLMEDCLRLWWLTGIGPIVAFQAYSNVRLCYNYWRIVWD